MTNVPKKDKCHIALKRVKSKTMSPNITFPCNDPLSHEKEDSSSQEILPKLEPTLCSDFGLQSSAGRQ